MVQILKDGKLVTSALKDIDIKKLNGLEQSELLHVVRKAERGAPITMTDLRAVDVALQKGK